MKDIAFFHHRLTVDTEFNADRIRLLRQVCGVLRDVAAGTRKAVLLIDGSFV
jgi:hypothetical protein